ncbi:hypothetical protein IA57_11115 [Mangrovimonas yunxiaonensis]|uniref:Import component protein n=1 Tax=Mangrovimonas yunxiaonensis TaxID=1197477 RepID=A0A084TJU2_9FLAO|nr:membrane protein [Mangrovimonas yunxiaonensis]KFB00978.1 hypothetical protein IA57_11115 [Mangrovimonas yunxiaonensis]MBR9758165.1 hypothetical protein [Algicola sp.]GGH43236.1 hypothetical protein GCM10011364_15290 [Mangrovimonas yunxiaonensis]
METQNQPPTHQSTAVDNSGKNIAIIAYITVIGLVLAFVMNQDKKHPLAQYHIVQALGLAVTGLSLGIIGMLPILGWLISILGSFALIFLWIMGLINAINENQKPLPVLGKYYEKWFASLL